MSVLFLGFNFVFMIVLPVMMGRWIARHGQAGWGLFGIGAVTFVLSQVGHIPFNWLVLQRLAWINLENLATLSLFLGLSAGAFEEVARFLTYRFWATTARSWRSGLMLGVGHGGIEAILLGVLGLINFVIFLGLKNGYFQGILASVPADQLGLVDQQIEALFSVPAALAVYGGLERIFSMLLHLSASLLVMQGFVRGRRWLWLGLAIGWHALVDGVVYYLAQTSGAVMAELVLGGMSFMSLGLIFWLYVPEKTAVLQPPLPPLQPLTPAATTHDSLERSKYSS